MKKFNFFEAGNEQINNSKIVLRYSAGASLKPFSTPINKDYYYCPKIVKYKLNNTEVLCVDFFYGTIGLLNPAQSIKGEQTFLKTPAAMNFLKDNFDDLIKKSTPTVIVYKAGTPTLEKIIKKINQLVEVNVDPTKTTAENIKNNDEKNTQDNKNEQNDTKKIIEDIKKLKTEDINKNSKIKTDLNRVLQLVIDGQAGKEDFFNFKTITNINITADAGKASEIKKGIEGIFDSYIFNKSFSHYLENVNQKIKNIFFEDTLKIQNSTITFPATTNNFRLVSIVIFPKNPAENRKFFYDISKSKLQYFNNDKLVDVGIEDFAKIMKLNSTTPAKSPENKLEFAKKLYIPIEETDTGLNILDKPIQINKPTNTNKFLELHFKIDTKDDNIKTYTYSFIDTKQSFDNIDKDTLLKTTPALEVFLESTAAKNEGTINISFDGNVYKAIAVIQKIKIADKYKKLDWEMGKEDFNNTKIKKDVLYIPINNDTNEENYIIMTFEPNDFPYYVKLTKKPNGLYSKELFKKENDTSTIADIISKNKFINNYFESHVPVKAKTEETDGTVKIFVAKNGKVTGEIKGKLQLLTDDEIKQIDKEAKDKEAKDKEAKDKEAKEEKTPADKAKEEKTPADKAKEEKTVINKLDEKNKTKYEENLKKWLLDTDQKIVQDKIDLLFAKKIGDPILFTNFGFKDSVVNHKNVTVNDKNTMAGIMILKSVVDKYDEVNKDNYQEIISIDEKLKTIVYSEEIFSEDGKKKISVIGFVSNNTSTNAIREEYKKMIAAAKVLANSSSSGGSSSSKSRKLSETDPNLATAINTVLSGNNVSDFLKENLKNEHNMPVNSDNAFPGGIEKNESFIKTLKALNKKINTSNWLDKKARKDLASAKTNQEKIAIYFASLNRSNSIFDIIEADWGLFDDEWAIKFIKKKIREGKNSAIVGDDEQVIENNKATSKTLLAKIEKGEITPEEIKNLAVIFGTSPSFFRKLVNEKDQKKKKDFIAKLTKIMDAAHKETLKEKIGLGDERNKAFERTDDSYQQKDDLEKFIFSEYYGLENKLKKRK